MKEKEKEVIIYKGEVNLFKKRFKNNNFSSLANQKFSTFGTALKAPKHIL